MSKSIADLRAEKAAARPERSLTLCLAPNLVAEMQTLSSELEHIGTEAAAAGPRRQGQGDPPRVAEIQARLAELLEQMAEYEGELGIRANLTDGDWRRWCNDHPARDEGYPGHEFDQRVTYGYCNADDLLDDLGPFVHTWNSEPLSAEDWSEAIEPRTAPGDKLEIARYVVAMYEGGSADFRPRRIALQSNLKRLSDFASPAPSASATTDSTAGSPGPFSADSTSAESPAV